MALTVEPSLVVGVVAQDRREPEVVLLQVRVVLAQASVEGVVEPE